MARILLFSAYVAVLVLVHAQAQSEFISIDCGIPENFNYTDTITNLTYVSDAKFIDSGEIKNISKSMNRSFERQFMTLRSFPVGPRNCYTIRTQGGGATRYLIRARFMYGDYGSEQRMPQFNLSLGVDLWDSVAIPNAYKKVTKELIHVPRLNYIQICLIDTGDGVPFISAIEIRSLDDNRTYVAGSASLMLHERADYGIDRNRSVRYPNDTFDRIWLPPSLPVPGSKNVSTSNHSIKPNIFSIPPVVLATAITPTKEMTNQPLNIPFIISELNISSQDQFYIYMHFTEISELQKGQFRAFNVDINGFDWYDSLSPSYLSTTTLYSMSGIGAVNGGRLAISMHKNESSSLPPLINAIEIFVEKKFPQLQTNQIEIDALQNIKLAYSLKKHWQGDPCYPKDYLWDGLNCSYVGVTQPNITSLNLSRSELTGGISTYISNLTMIQRLDLSNNNLSGTVPDFLAQLQFLTVLDFSNNNLSGTVPDFLAQLPFLTVLNLENNNLSGIIPRPLFERWRNGSLALRVENNPDLCLSEPCNVENRKKEYVIPLAASLGGVALALLIGGAVFWSVRRRKKQEKQTSGSSKQGEAFLVPENKKFTYSEILSITNNFERVIGKGGFGRVYHGYLHGIQVSVKMLSPASVQGYKQFQEEAQLLTTVHHENLTSVLGYCDEDTHQGLVYEHMENGNLADHLTEKSNHLLNWKERLRIALDAAQGLEYLHYGCNPPIIHRDLKCTNILLDKTFHAKLADFGMSKAFHLEDRAQASAAVGTPGYLDPEYFLTNKLTEKSDVYSFGVILLELVTGQPAITKSQDKTHVTKWIASMLKEGDIKNIIDPKLGLITKKNSIWKFIELAMTCVSPSSTERPTMSKVVMELKQCLDFLENSHENNGDFTPSLDLFSVSLTSLTDSNER